MRMSIGELARRTGVKVPTIRYYEGVGLMPAPSRTDGQQRRYDADAASRLSFIRHGRELGFEVEAIRELLALSAEPNRSCADVDVIARRQRFEVERRLARLTALRGELHRMLDACGHGLVSHCRVIETLADHRLCEHEHAIER